MLHHEWGTCECERTVSDLGQDTCITCVVKHEDDPQLYQLYHHGCLCHHQLYHHTCHPDLDPEEDWCNVHQDDCHPPGPNINDCEYKPKGLKVAKEDRLNGRQA